MGKAFGVRLVVASYRARELLLTTTCVLGALACDRALGLGEFGVIDLPPDSSVTEPQTRCGPTSVPAGGPEDGCTFAGVTTCGPGALLDSSGGCVATLPSQLCPGTSVEVLGVASCQPLGHFAPCAGETPVVPQGVDEVDVRYVKAGGIGAGADPSPPRTFATIGAALADVPVNGAVLVGPGTYDEDVVIEKPGVRLVGVCPDEVMVVGQISRVTPGSRYPCAISGASAALCIAPGSHGAAVRGIRVSGPGDGIAVVGATDVSISLVAVTRTEHYGIRVEESLAEDGSRSAAAATLEYVLVKEARGAGIYVAGAELTAKNHMTVSATRPLNEYQGYGVSVVPAATGLDRNSQVLSDRTRSRVMLEGVSLVGNADAALHVRGSIADVRDSFLGNLSGDGAPTGGGVLAEREMMQAGSSAEVSLVQTVIQRTSDAAIDVRSSAVTLDQVTVRETLGRAPDGCSGQGIRARADRLAPATVVVNHSLVESSRQAAIHVLGAKVGVASSILRGSIPGDADPTCGPHLGDGITLEPLPPKGSPTLLTLDHALIEQNARAAIAVFGGTVTSTASVLARNRYGIVDARRAREGDASAASYSNASVAPSASGLTCDFSGDAGLRSCDVEMRPLEPWTSPGAASGHTPSNTEEWRALVHIAGNFTDSLEPLPDGVALVPGFPEVAPDFPGPDGCATLHGVPKDVSYPRDGRRYLIWAPGTAPVTAQMAPGVVPFCNSSFPGTGRLDATMKVTVGGGEPLDMNGGVVFITPVPERVDQRPESGSTWRVLGGSSARYNVDPGWHRFDFGCTVGAVLLGEPVAETGTEIRALIAPGTVANVGPSCRP